MGPRLRRSTVLPPLEETIVVEFRRRSLLPPDAVLGRLRETIPTLSRSALHRCLQRCLQREERSSMRGRFAETTVGYVHIDACEVRSSEGRLHLFLAIDRVSKFTDEVHLRRAALQRDNARLISARGKVQAPTRRAASHIGSWSVADWIVRPCSRRAPAACQVRYLLDGLALVQARGAHGASLVAPMPPPSATRARLPSAGTT